MHKFITFTHTSNGWLKLVLMDTFKYVITIATNIPSFIKALHAEAIGDIFFK